MYSILYNQPGVASQAAKFSREKIWPGKRFYWSMVVHKGIEVVHGWNIYSTVCQCILIEDEEVNRPFVIATIIYYATISSGMYTDL